MTTGTSIQGYQLLDSLPYSTNRIFIRVANVFPLQILYKGTISVEYEYLDNGMPYVIDAKPFWRQGLLFFGLPEVSTPPEPVIKVVANWRQSGLDWLLETE